MFSTRSNIQDGEETDGFQPASQYVDSEYESSSDGQRAGRFFGPDSSWRYYTHVERALATSLQEVENNDLSIALYDVHSMRVRARGRESVSIARPWHSKKRWVDIDQDGKAPFQPPAKWTAWPLKPGAVPRSREVWGASIAPPDVAADTYSKPDPWKPSLSLEEELKAGFLRQAKHRFSWRQWEDDISLSGAVARSNGTSHGSEDEQSAMRDTEQAGSLPDGKDQEPERFNPPIFMADDDVANVILRPTVRHIISRQDDLLAALHQSRRGHRMDHPFSTRAKRKAQSRSGSMTRTEKSRKRKRVVSNAVPSDAKTSDDHADIETDPKPSRKPRGKYRRAPGQRDWSEVLGVAAMIGWDQSVIDRAARRCAAIFGETMSMRYMAEASQNHFQDQVVDYLPDMIPPIDIPAATQTEECFEEEMNICPHTSCKRHEEPYEKRWRLREHLKKHHRYSAKDLEEWKMHAAERDRRRALAADQSSEDVELEVESLNLRSRANFLEPITVRIGRSRDKRPRASASRSRSRTAATTRVSEEDAVVGGSAMSTDSEL